MSIASNGTLDVEIVGNVSFPEHYSGQTFCIEVNFNPRHPDIPTGWEATIATLQPYGEVTVAELHGLGPIAVSRVLGRFSGVELVVGTDLPGLMVHPFGTLPRDGVALRSGQLYRVGPNALVNPLRPLRSHQRLRIAVAKRKVA